MDSTWLCLSVIYGAVGAGLIVYGKKQREPIPAIAGILLSICPMIIESTAVLLLVGVVCVAVPWFVRPR